MSTLCEIYFQMKFVTTPNESVRIIGNLNELGNWDPAKGLVLEPQSDDLSLWISSAPLKVEKKTKIEFKCVVMEGKTVRRWENFPNNANRKYKAKYIKTTLKGSENDDGGKEFINEKGVEEELKTNTKQKEHKPDSTPKKQQYFIHSKGSDLGLNENTQIKRPVIGSLNPLDGDVESEDSNNSSFLDCICDEKTPQKKLLQDREPPPQVNLDEIASVKSSDSMDYEAKLGMGVGINNFGIPQNLMTSNSNRNMNFSMIFKKLKEKHFKKKTKSPSVLKSGFFQQEIDNNGFGSIFIDQNYQEKYSCENDNMIFVCKFLPIKISKNELGVLQAEIIQDSNQFYLSRHLLNGNYKKVICMGMLREFIGEPDRIEVSALLKKSFNCRPIFLNHVVKEMFLLSHEIFSMLDSLIINTYYSKSLSIDKFWGDKQSAWEVLSQINEKYCQCLQEFKNSSYENILISDYHFILTPKLLVDQGFNFNIGFYFNANFPTFEVFRLFPFKDEFIGGLISCDMIYFNCFEQARPFFTALLLEKNIKINHKLGLLYFISQNKYTYIKLKCVTIDSTAIRSLPKITIPMITAMKSDFNIILGIDRVSELTGVDQKMRLVAQWVNETQNKYKVKLVQILQKPYYGPLSEKQKVWLENIRKIAKELNRAYKEDEQLIELLEIDLNEQESLYLMSKAKVLINTSIKNEYCIDSMKFVLTNENNGHVLLSEFMNYNRSCSSIFSFNPLKYNDFKEKIESLFKMQPQFSKDLINSDVSYLLKYPINSWFSEFFTDLKSINHSKKFINSIPTFNPSLPFFELSKFAIDYERTKNRIFIFEFFGTLVRSTSITDLNRFSKKSIRRAYQLNENLMKSLQILMQDDRNIIYVITSKSANNLDIALGNVHDIGLAAESGYLYKLKGKSKWSKLITIDWSWKEVVRKNMENYTKNTLGSTLEIKESALVWHYEDVASELAEMQSKSLLSHLKSSLEKIKDVDIFLGNKFIEAKPVGISKGTFIALLLESYQSVNDIDFIMMMGGDKEMFSKIREFIKENTQSGLEDLIKKYSIWVGPERKEGDYFLPGIEEVGVLMQNLSQFVFSK